MGGCFQKTLYAKKNDREGETRSFYGERRIWFGVYGGNLYIRHALLVPFPFISLKLRKYAVFRELAGIETKGEGSIICTREHLPCRERRFLAQAVLILNPKPAQAKYFNHPGARRLQLPKPGQE
jgi:hypothetical protein